MTLSREVIEAATHSTVEEPIGSIEDIKMGDMVKFKDDDADQQLRGLPGHVRGLRGGKADVYVGSSLRTEVDAARLMKLVKKS
jgi:hypothetical protein